MAGASVHIVGRRAETVGREAARMRGVEMMKAMVYGCRAVGVGTAVRVWAEWGGMRRGARAGVGRVGERGLKYVETRHGSIVAREIGGGEVDEQMDYMTMCGDLPWICL